MNTSLIFSSWKTPEYWAFILLSHLLLSLFIWLDFWSGFLPPEGNHYMMMIVGQKNDVISSAFQISPKLCWFQREHVPTSDGHACVLIIGTWICEPGFWLEDVSLHDSLPTGPGVKEEAPLQTANEMPRPEMNRSRIRMTLIVQRYYRRAVP